MDLKSFFRNQFLTILVIGCRYYIAYQMFSYGFAKIFKTQFNLGPIYLADEAINHFNGFMLTWNYFGFSRTYSLIIAGLQIFIGFLLLFRKTVRGGVILFLSMMTNIVLINYFYKIDGAMSFSLLLLSLGMFLLLYEWKLYTRLFFKTNTKEKVVNTILPEKIRNLYWLKFLIIPLMLFYAYNYISDIKNKYLSGNELTGIWKAIPTNYSNRYYKLFVGDRNDLKIKDFNDNFYYGEYIINETEKTLKINAECYTETGAFIVQDSIDKMKISEDSIKVVKKRIINYLNSKRKSLPYDELFEYEQKNDTLFLNNTTLNLKMVNITNNYKQ